MKTDDVYSTAMQKAMEFLESEEGQLELRKMHEKFDNEAAIKESQLTRFHEKFQNSFSEIVEKVIAKYNGDKHIDKWYKKGAFPPGGLKWLLYEYAKKYGRECSGKEWEQHGNMFSESLFFVGGYYFTKMNGMGTVIKIIKKP